MKRRIGILVPLLVLAVGGCGGSTKPSGGPVATGSAKTAPGSAKRAAQAQLAAQADPICSQGEQAVSGAGTNAPAVIAQYIGRLAAVQPPPSLRADYSSWISTLRKTLALAASGSSMGVGEEQSLLSVETGRLFPSSSPCNHFGPPGT